MYSSNDSTTASNAINVISPVVNRTDDTLIAQFDYKRNNITTKGNRIEIQQECHHYRFQTQLKPSRTGILLVGLGGNNGSTLFGAVIANQKRLSWKTKTGRQSANYFGSITQSTTVHIGWDGQHQIYIPFKSILPIVDPNELIIGGWDINDANMHEAMLRAQVFEPELIEKLLPFTENVTPMPSIYYPEFIASNQARRANNLIAGSSKKNHLIRIRQDIREFKEKNNLDCVIVLWTANTERYTEIRYGLNKTADEILAAIDNDADEISPSNLFAVAAILEGAHYINGSPQNTLTPGIIALAESHRVFIGGDDFKSGQTKVKSVLVDFLVSSGLKPESIVSYNHLGNNDGQNLSEQPQFRSKEISKSCVVDDMVASNRILYAEGEKPDHVIVIKYVPFVGDSKRAMDEYTCSIFMGGRQTIAMHNTCEDSLLAAPLILDLVLLTELFTRIRYTIVENPTQNDTVDGQFQQFHSVLSLLSLLLKAPVVPPGTPVTNAFMRQSIALAKLMTICAGIHADHDLQLEFFTKLAM